MAEEFSFKKEINFIFKMNPKMKVALEDIKYIQTQIQKILQISKGSQLPNQKLSPQNRSSRLMKDNFSSSFKNNIQTSPFNTIKSKSKSSSQVSLTKNNSKSPSASQKTKNKEQISVKKKKSSKSKKSVNAERPVSPDQSKATQQKSNQIKKDKDKSQIMTLKQVQSELFESKLEKKSQVPPLVKIQKENSTKELFNKWARIDKGQTPKSKVNQIQNQIYKRVTFYQQQQQSIMPIQQKMMTQPSKQKKQTKQIGKTNELNKKSPRNKPDSPTSSKSIIYCVEPKSETPYYKNKRNALPIRTDEDYLQKKYKQKKLQKQKKEALKQKYQMLDERLNRIRGELNISPIEKMTQEEKKKNKQSRKYKEVLKQYLRYSPLSKLVKTNEKLKIQSQRMRSLELTTKSADSKAMKLMSGYGRPIFGL